jgi:hypothetical protein
MRFWHLKLLTVLKSKLHVRWLTGINKWCATGCYDIIFYVDSCPLFFPDVVFPWFMYANISLEKLLLSIHLTMWQFITDAQTKHASMVGSSFKIGHVSHLLILSHRLSLNIITTVMKQRALQSVNRRTFSAPIWSSFNVANTSKFYSSVSECLHYFVHLVLLDNIHWMTA